MDKTMNETAQKTKYQSFEDFRRAFYPEASKTEDSQQQDQSYAREMARYVVEKHFPTRDPKETG